MKKTLLSLSILFSFAVNAQLTQSNHAPAIGDPIFGTYQCDSTGITPGASGAGATWNYSVVPHISVLNTFTTSASTDISYNPADIAVSSAANNTLYYKSSATELNYYGGDLAIATFDLKVKYSSPAIVAIYPMSLNSTTTSITGGTINVTSPIPASGTFTGNCIITADATGTLTLLSALPTKTFTNTIRVTTSQTISSSIGGGVTVNYIVYDYYSADDSKAPIFTINTSTITSGFGTSTQTIVTVLKNYNDVSVKEKSKNAIELSVFPNPASNFINFTTLSTEAVKILVFDVTGKIIASELMETGKAKMNTGSLTSGVYLYHVIGKNNQVLTTGKFNVTK